MVFKHVRPIHLLRLSLTHTDDIQEEQDVDLSDTSVVTAVCRIEVNVGPGGPNEIEINLNAPEGHDPKVTLKYVNLICTVTSYS